MVSFSDINDKIFNWLMNLFPPILGRWEGSPKPNWPRRYRAFACWCKQEGRCPDAFPETYGLSWEYFDNWLGRLDKTSRHIDRMKAIMRETPTKRRKPQWPGIPPTTHQKRLLHYQDWCRARGLKASVHPTAYGMRWTDFDKSPMDIRMDYQAEIDAQKYYSEKHRFFRARAEVTPGSEHIRIIYIEEDQWGHPLDAASAQAIYSRGNLWLQTKLPRSRGSE